MRFLNYSMGCCCRLILANEKWVYAFLPSSAFGDAGGLKWATEGAVTPQTLASATNEGFYFPERCLTLRHWIYTTIPVMFLKNVSQNKKVRRKHIQMLTIIVSPWWGCGTRSNWFLLFFCSFNILSLELTDASIIEKTILIKNNNSALDP